jgi:hypothetical protein
MRSFVIAAALVLGGCASTYQLNVMPRDTGKIYTGVADDAGGSEGRIAITIEGKEYVGTWVETSPSSSSGYTSGGVGYGSRGWGWRGGVGFVTMDNPNGGESKALLSAADGSGLRCDFRSAHGFRGGGVCRDDKGREYDVQVRRSGSLQ